MRSRAEQLWIGGGAVGVLLVSALAWFFVVSPELNNASSLRQRTADAQTGNISLQAKVHKLQADYQNRAALQTDLASARAALPTNADISDFTTQLKQQAQLVGVQPQSIVVASTVPIGVSTSSTGKQTAAAGHLFAIPVTVIVKGTPAADIAFLNAVEGITGRAALIGSAQLSTDPSVKGGAGIQLSVQLQLFAAPQSQQDQKALDALANAS